MTAQVLYLNVGYISRGNKAGLHAAAAYRSGETLYETLPGDEPSLAGKMAYDSGTALNNTAQRKEHDYTRKEHVVSTTIHAPDNAPSWTQDLQSLCDAITTEETRKNARLARKFEISLPRGLSDEQLEAVCKQFCDTHFTRHGLVAMSSIHRSRASDGEDNPHAHILVTTRTISAEGWNSHKNNIRWMNSKATLAHWRKTMGEYANNALKTAGVDRPVTYQSYASQGIDREVTKPLGYEADALEKQGVATERGDENRAVRERNALREQRAKNDGQPVPAPIRTREEKLVGFLCHAARTVVGGHQQVAFTDDPRALLKAAAKTLRGFDRGEGTNEQHDAARKLLASGLETFLRMKKRSLTTFTEMADALEGIADRVPEIQEQGRQARAEQEQRAYADWALEHHWQERKDNDPLWADFGARVGAEGDAARDALHRHRQKEGAMSDKETEETRKTLRTADTRAQELFQGHDRQEQAISWQDSLIGKAEAYTRQKEQERQAALTETVRQDAESTRATKEEQQTIDAAIKTVGQAINKVHGDGAEARALRTQVESLLRRATSPRSALQDDAATQVTYKGEVSPAEYGQLARPSMEAMAPRQASITERYRGRTLDGNDQPRSPRLPAGALRQPSLGPEQTNNRSAPAGQNNRIQLSSISTDHIARNLATLQQTANNHQQEPSQPSTKQPSAADVTRSLLKQDNSIQLSQVSSETIARSIALLQEVQRRKQAQERLAGTQEKSQSRGRFEDAAKWITNAYYGQRNQENRERDGR